MLKKIDELVRQIEPKQVYRYKEKDYRVQTVTIGMLSQDEGGEWVPTVIYAQAKDTHDTQVVGSVPLNFARPITDFAGKFVLSA